MNRKLNVKLLLMLFLGSAALVVTVHYVHKYQVGRNTSGLLKRAEQAREQGDLFSAVKYQKRYLNYRRDDYEQLSKLALYMKEMTEKEGEVSSRDFWRRTRSFRRPCAN